MKHEPQHPHSDQRPGKAARQRTGFVLWFGLGLSLAGCGASPAFVEPPPPAYRTPLPAELDGVWAREGRDNGERVRLSRQQDGTVRLDFFKFGPAGPTPLPGPLRAQTLRFADMDWLLLDWRDLSALEGATYTGPAPFRLVRYVLEDADRLCGIEPSASLFAEGIKAGELAGRIDDYAPGLRYVTVSAAGVDWVRWWRGLAPERRQFAAPVFCFQRVE